MINATDKQVYLITRLLKEGLVDECINELSLLLLRFPDHGRGNALLGNLYLKHLINYSGAEVCFGIALRSDPLNPELYYDFSELLIILEKFTEAVAVINKGFEIPGIDKGRLFYLMGLFYEKQMEMDQAIVNYTESILHSDSDAFIKKTQSAIARCLLKRGMK